MGRSSVVESRCQVMATSWGALLRNVMRFIAEYTSGVLEGVM